MCLASFRFLIQRGIRQGEDREVEESPDSRSTQKAAATSKTVKVDSRGHAVGYNSEKFLWLIHLKNDSGIVTGMLCRIRGGCTQLTFGDHELV